MMKKFNNNKFFLTVPQDTQLLSVTTTNSRHETISTSVGHLGSVQGAAPAVANGTHGESKDHDDKYEENDTCYCDEKIPPEKGGEIEKYQRV